MAKTKNSGLAIDSPGFFTDSPLKKIYLAEYLGVARSTIWQWHKVAYYRVPGFKEAYPLKADGRVDKAAPLSSWQCWVLSQIGRLFKLYGTEERVKFYIQQNPDDFSIYTFKVALKKVMDN